MEAHEEEKRPKRPVTVGGLPTTEYFKRYRKNNLARIKSIKQLGDQTIGGRYGTYKRAAKARGIEFKLTLDDFKRHWQMNCFYCGDAIKTIGLDRIDNSVGYVDGNVVPACALCNRAKLTASPEVFIEMCMKIAYRFS